MRNKLNVGDTARVGNRVVEVVSLSDFGGVPHYGLNWRQEDSFMKVPGWMPVILLDSMLEVPSGEDCGEDIDAVVPAYELQDGSGYYPENAGVRCNCEDAPCCGH
jgi:hypothetical protein